MAYYNKYKGLGARKLYNAISKVFIGVSEREIQTYLNSLQSNQRLHPHFNKPPLKPVTSDGVMDLIQMDLVDMQKNTVEINKHIGMFLLFLMFSADFCSYGHSSQSHQRRLPQPCFNSSVIFFWSSEDSPK